MQLVVLHGGERHGALVVVPSPEGGGRLEPLVFRDPPPIRFPEPVVAMATILSAVLSVSLGMVDLLPAKPLGFVVVGMIGAWASHGRPEVSAYVDSGERDHYGRPIMRPVDLS